MAVQHAQAPRIAHHRTATATATATAATTTTTRQRRLLLARPTLLLALLSHPSFIAVACVCVALLATCHLPAASAASAPCHHHHRHFDHRRAPPSRRVMTQQEAHYRQSTASAAGQQRLHHQLDGGELTAPVTGAPHRRVLAVTAADMKAEVQLLHADIATLPQYSIAAAALQSAFLKTPAAVNPLSLVNSTILLPRDAAYRSQSISASNTAFLDASMPHHIITSRRQFSLLECGEPLPLVHVPVGWQGGTVAGTQLQRYTSSNVTVILGPPSVATLRAEIVHPSLFVSPFFTVQGINAVLYKPA